MKGKIIEVYGMEKNLKGWADYLGISKQLLNYKIKKSGKSVEDTILIEMYKGYIKETESKECSEKIETNKVISACKTKESKKKKVMIINDVHVPYQHEKLLDEIKKHKNIDYLVIGGDLIDCESCSSFQMLERPTLEEELVAAHEFIQEINKIINAEIICIKGNHEERLEREICKMQNKGLQRLLDSQLLRMLEEGFKFSIGTKRKKYKAIENFKYIDKWYARLFDNLVICHPKDFSNVPAKIAEKSAEYFLNRGIIEKDDIIFIGHTHKFSQIVSTRRQDVFVVENGCSCKPMDYSDR
ncbi:MAG: metallophosphoesterase, partial [Clostridiales bacterium]|uniref:metallophosphoesterase n=1 Tax=Terrisporobacter sp. TaxID=1965305 RepID=UPI002A594F5F